MMNRFFVSSIVSKKHKQLLKPFQNCPYKSFNRSKQNQTFDNSTNPVDQNDDWGEVDQWEEFIHTKKPKPISTKASKTHIKKTIDSELDKTLSNLGLEKYAKLYEENFEALKSNDDRPDEETKVRYFEDFLEQRQFHEHRIEDYEKLIDSPKTRERIAFILKEYELEKYNTSQVPSHLTLDIMKDLLFCETETELMKQILYHFKREASRYSRAQKKMADKIETENRQTQKHSKNKYRTGLEFDDETGAPVYSKWKNTMFISFNREMLRKENDRRVRDALLFGPKLMIDFGYPPDMFRRQTYATLCTQIFFLLAEVMVSKVPFHVTLCNLDKTSPFYEHLNSKMSHLFNPQCLISCTEKSYLDLIPKTQLVYLSADAPKTLQSVDSDKTYILGGMCDKHCHGNHSYLKAKSEGIASYKLPLDDYFFFQRDRNLAMNLVVGILEKYLECQDWRTALIGRIPIRKIKTPEELQSEQLRKVRKFYSKEKYMKIYRSDSKEIHLDNQQNDLQFDHFARRQRIVEQSPPPPYYSPRFHPNQDKIQITYKPSTRSASRRDEKKSSSHRDENM